MCSKRHCRSRALRKLVSLTHPGSSVSRCDGFCVVLCSGGLDLRSTVRTPLVCWLSRRYPHTHPYLVIAATYCLDLKCFRFVYCSDRLDLSFSSLKNALSRQAVFRGCPSYLLLLLGCSDEFTRASFDSTCLLKRIP